MTPRPVVFTVGHGDSSFADLEGRLAPHHVQAIVDVRSTPYSRHAPEFRKAELEAIASESGYGYRWLGDRLGGRPTDPALLSSGRADVAKIVASQAFHSGILELLALAEAARVVLLCAEVDHQRCHRAAWIADALEDHGVVVRHITADGTAVRHQQTLDV